MEETTEFLKSKLERFERRVQELESNEIQLDLVIKSTGIGIWDWNVQTGETIFNERWANIIGYTLEEISPVSIKTWMKYAHPVDLQDSNRLLEEHWAGKTQYYICESRMKHRSGQWIWVYDTGQVIEWESEGIPRRMIGTHLDITEQKNTQLLLDKANKELERLVHTDPLTKIANRRAYDKRLKSELVTAKRTGKPLFLLLVDIDHFKQYNDIYGHEKGDIAIQRVAQQLDSVLHRETDFVARYGGEEFAILLPSTPLDRINLICKDIANAIGALNIEHQVSKFDWALTISIGGASTEGGFENLFQRADKALYYSKNNGRNRYTIIHE